MKNEIKHSMIDGLECHVISGQDKNDHPPLLFVHGAFAGAWIWSEYFLPWFGKKNYPCWAFSMRGHGGSKGREKLDWHSIDDYVTDLVRIVLEVEKEEKKKPILIGHSMGGFVIQKYLEKHDAAAVVLLSSVPPQGLLASQFTLMFQNPLLMIEINRWFNSSDHVNVSAKTLQDTLFHQPVDKDKINIYLGMVQKESQRAVWDMTAFALFNFSQMNVPPMLILGTEHDQLVPPFLVEATARVYNAPCHIFPKMGHGMMIEPGWETIASNIDQWVTKLDSSHLFTITE